METLILTFDTIALVAVVFFSYKNEKFPDRPEIGPFRIRTGAPEPVVDKRNVALRYRRGR